MKQAIPNLTFNNGVEIPQFGLGVFKSQPGTETRQAVEWALELGYRHVDTAAYYRNEKDVGDAIRASGIAREEVFVTTKVWNDDHGFDQTLRAFDRSLEELGFDTVDLFLVHWPVTGTFQETYRACERIYEEGRARAIGVSNFEPHHLQELAQSANVVPVVNQVELSPYLPQLAIREYCEQHRILVQGWSPLSKGHVVADPVLSEIGKAHGKSAVQVTIRWHLQHGFVTIPKSVKRERIETNMNVFDFELTADQMRRIDGLDRGEEGRTGPHPDTFV